MPVNPSFLERLVLLRLNKGPAPMLDLFGASSFRSVTLALEIGLFETIADVDRPLTAEDLADRLDAHPDGIAVFCNFLVSEGYLEAVGNRYRLTGMTKKWLLAESETNMGPWLTYWNDLVFPFWEQELETAIREGEPSQSIYEWFDEDPARWETAQEGFRATASLLVDDVVDAMTVPAGQSRLLDVGGGHGLYAMELCRRHSNLTATVFDYPGAIDAMEDDIPDELAGRLGTRTGDYWTDDLGEGYDMALLFNVVHAHSPAENTALFERVRDALAPGGRIVVLDQWEGSGRTPVSRAGLRFVALTYHTTLGANVYEHDEVSSWLQAAGFTGIQRQSVGPISGMAIVEATKQ
ncbi:methyltransferase [Halogeometricum borinquense]|uniref:methyltransferase n=1 Tax=Halogeometricum borinquense TaxID=60847 RepID=UPI003430AB2B